jgi:hypothetical protein
LIALLVAVVAGSGLLFAFNTLNKPPTTSQANSVVGSVSFLSSPSAPPGSIDEVKITIQGINDAPSGKQYYAWLVNQGESSSSVSWSVTPHNNSLSSIHTDPHLLANNPGLFLITLETAGIVPSSANFDPNARRYYASLPPNIQNSATFPIRMCPQGGSNNTCY